MQTFPVPEPNVSGLSCWFCHLLPWKLGLCPLLEHLLSISQVAPALSVPHPWGLYITRVVSSCIPSSFLGLSSIPGESMIPSHNLSLFSLLHIWGNVRNLSSLALGDRRTPALLHCVLVPLLCVPCLSQPVTPSLVCHSAPSLALRCHAGFWCRGRGAGRTLAQRLML